MFDPLLIPPLEPGIPDPSEPLWDPVPEDVPEDPLESAVRDPPLEFPLVLLIPP